MTDIVIVGKAYYADRAPDQGLPPGRPPGIWGGPPLYPDQGLPGSQPHPSHPIAPGGGGGQPSHPIYHPGHPDHGLPAYPDQGLPGVPPGFWGGVAPPYPDQGLPQPPQGSGTPVPEDVYTPAPIPEEIASQVVVSVYNPKTMGWTTKSYPPR